MKRAIYLILDFPMLLVGIVLRMVTSLTPIAGALFGLSLMASNVGIVPDSVDEEGLLATFKFVLTHLPSCVKGALFTGREWYLVILSIGLVALVAFVPTAIVKAFVDGWTPPFYFDRCEGILMKIVYGYREVLEDIYYFRLGGDDADHPYAVTSSQDKKEMKRFKKECAFVVR